MRARRSSSDEFKAGAVQQGIGEGRVVTEVAKSLDRTRSAMDAWVKQALADAGMGAPMTLTSSEKEESAQLRRENSSVPAPRLTSTGTTRPLGEPQREIAEADEDERIEHDGGQGGWPGRRSVTDRHNAALEELQGKATIDQVERRLADRPEAVVGWRDAALEGMTAALRRGDGRRARERELEQEYSTLRDALARSAMPVELPQREVGIPARGPSRFEAREDGWAGRSERAASFTPPGCTTDSPPGWCLDWRGTLHLDGPVDPDEGVELTHHGWLMVWGSLSARPQCRIAPALALGAQLPAGRAPRPATPAHESPRGSRGAGGGSGVQVSGWPTLGRRLCRASPRPRHEARRSPSPSASMAAEMASSGYRL